MVFPEEETRRLDFFIRYSSEEFLFFVMGGFLFMDQRQLLMVVGIVDLPGIISSLLLTPRLEHQFLIQVDPDCDLSFLVGYFEIGDNAFVIPQLVVNGKINFTRFNKFISCWYEYPATETDVLVLLLKK